MTRALLILSLLAAIGVKSARADEQMLPIEQDGDWIAVEHRPSMTDPPDVCLAIASNYNFALRTDEDDNEIRFGNDNWSLPADVSGSLKVAVNGHTYTYDISGNTNTNISAVLSDGDLQTLVADMNVASSMTVTAGSSQPATIPLDGSKAVVTAYLTCANINQPGSTGGVNPFQSSTPTANQ